jgi:hypothetical protein
MKQRLVLVFAACMVVLAATESAAQEQAELTTPIARTVTAYEVVQVTLQRWPEWVVRVEYLDNTLKPQNDTHRGTEAQTLIVALNKADLSVKSLERRVLEHLIAEGKIPPATITGTPR